MGCCSSKDKWRMDFSPTELSSNKCDADWEQVTGEQATFGMGSHWAPAARFGSVYGVIRVRVGFAGGSEPKPSYNDPLDYTEAINLQYDPQKVTYQQLLDIFWGYHDCTMEYNTPQYMSVIYYHDDAQKDLADLSLVEMVQKIERSITTKLSNYTTFVPVEDEYQHYLLQQQKDIFDLLKIPLTQLAHSHLAAKVEGYICGYAKPAQFDEEVNELFLPDKIASGIRKMCVQNQPPEEGADRYFP